MTKPKSPKAAWELETRYDPGTGEPFKAKRRGHRFASDRTRMAWHRGRVKGYVAKIGELEALATSLVRDKAMAEERLRTLVARCQQRGVPIG